MCAQLKQTNWNRIHNRYSTMASKHLKKCSAFFAIKEKEIKTTLRFRLIHVRMVRSVEQMTAHGELSLLLGGSIKLYSHYGNQYGSSSDNWESFYLDATIPLLVVYPKNVPPSYYKYTCVTIFITALFIITINSYVCERLLVDDWCEMVLPLRNIPSQVGLSWIRAS